MTTSQSNKRIPTTDKLNKYNTVYNLYLNVTSFTEPSATNNKTEVHPITMHSFFLKFTRDLFTWATDPCFFHQVLLTIKYRTLSQSSVIQPYLSHYNQCNKNKILTYLKMNPEIRAPGLAGCNTNIKMFLELRKELLISRKPKWIH